MSFLYLPVVYVVPKSPLKSKAVCDNPNTQVLFLFLLQVFVTVSFSTQVGGPLLCQFTSAAYSI
jgi:hypothetical protein